MTTRPRAKPAPAWLSDPLPGQLALVLPQSDDEQSPDMSDDEQSDDDADGPSA